MKSIISFLLLISLQLNSISSQKKQTNQIIQSITFQGNNNISTRRLSSLLKTKMGNPFNEETINSDMQTITELYFEDGFLDVRIDYNLIPLNGKSSKLKINIHEMKRIKIGNLTIEGLKAKTKDDLFSKIENKPNRFFNKKKVEADVERLISFYEETGYPFVKISLINFERKKEFLNFTIHIEEGPKVIIEGIKIRGAEVTHENVIKREFRIKKGDTYKESRIQEGIRRLKRLGFWSEIKEPEIISLDKNENTSDSLLTIILLNLKEGRPSIIEGILGVNPNTQGRGVLLNGSLNLSMRNLFGTGRNLKTIWNRPNSKTSNLLFGYEEPYLLSLPITFEISLLHWIQDSTYIKTSGNISFYLSLSEHLSFLFGGGRERTIPGQRIGNQILRSESSTTSFGINYKSTDNPENPFSGTEDNLKLSYALKHSFGKIPKDEKVTKIESDAVFYLPTIKNPSFSHTIALSIHGKTIFSTEKFIPIYEKFFLGGAGSLRGYFEQQFLGSVVAWSNLEYRILLSRDSRAFIFLDSGYYYDKKYNPTFRDSAEIVRDKKIGYGLGFRISSKAGLLKLDYGLGEGDSPIDGKVHLGIETRF